MFCLVGCTAMNVRVAKMHLPTQVEEKQWPNETLLKMVTAVY